MTPGRVGRAFWQLVGVTLGLALFLTTMFSRFGVWVWSQPVWAAGGTQSVRMLPYNTSAERLRDPTAHADARNKLPAEVGLQLVLGSSELSSPVSQNPSRFLPTNISDFDMFLNGRGYTQSLVHAILLSAMAESIDDKVVLIVSPQWFTPAGATPEAFQSVFSQAAYNGMLRDDKLPAGLRDRLQARAAELGAASPPAARPREVVESSVGRVSDAAAARIEILQSANKAAPYHDPYAVPEGAVPVDEFDWDGALAEAAAEGDAASSNEFNVYDAYFAKYMEEKLPSLKGSAADIDYSLDSPEWGDLGLFLDVAEAHDLEVLLVSVPMHGLWSDYTGYGESKRAQYYERVRALAQEKGVALADFSDREYEPYFLADVMHLGWKGWLYVTRAVVDFYRS